MYGGGKNPPRRDHYTNCTQSGKRTKQNIELDVFLRVRKRVVNTVLCMRHLLGLGPPNLCGSVTVCNVMRGWGKGETRTSVTIWLVANERGDGGG